MKALKTAVVAQKKPPIEIMRKRKAEKTTTKKVKKDTNAPKRPPSAFFIFMDDFRKMFKEKFPDIKSAAAVVKAGGEKWKSMSDAEKAPSVEKATKMKAEYEKACKEHTEKLNGFGDNIAPEESWTSTSEVRDEYADQEASS